VHVIEKRASQQDRVTAELKDFREGKGRIQSMFGLAGSKATRHIQSRCNIKGTIKRRSRGLQAAMISNGC
jgi:hypothetical protein